MNALKTLAVFSVLATSAVAQNSGLFVTAGGGLANVESGQYTQTTSYGEVLRTTDTSDRVGFAQVGLGYRFNEKWDALLSYTDYAEGEVALSFPVYPGIFTIQSIPGALPRYSRNVLIYEATRFSFAPGYTVRLSESFTLRARAGVSWTKTDSHNETTYAAPLSGVPTSDRTATKSKDTWSYLASLGLEYALSKNWSIGVGATYSPFEIKVTPTRIEGVGSLAPGGATQPSKNSIDADMIEAVLSVTWRR